MRAPTTPPATDAGDQDSVTATVPSGPVGLSEAAGTNTSLSDYVSSYLCVNFAEGSNDAPISGDGTSIPGLVVTDGDDWRCTLTNERKRAVVKLTKIIVAVDQQLGDPGKFDLNIDGEGDNDKTRTDAVNGDSVTANVPNGDVALSEAGGTQTSLSDYTLDYECVNVAEGSDDAPISGDGTTITGLVAQFGDEWQCTFTNTRKHGDVKLVKDIVPVDEQLGDPGKFDLHIDGEGAYDATKHGRGRRRLGLADGPERRRQPRRGRRHGHEPGRLHEQLPLRERAREQRRRAGHRRGHVDRGPPVDDGDDWTCTFTNTRKSGHVKLVKDIVPVDEQLGDPGKFDLHIDGEGAYDATKTDAGDGDSVELTVPNGDVDLSEAAGTGTSLSDYTASYVCVNGGGPRGRAGHRRRAPRSTDLHVAAGDDWTLHADATPASRARSRSPR